MIWQPSVEFKHCNLCNGGPKQDIIPLDHWGGSNLEGLGTTDTSRMIAAVRSNMPDGNCKYSIQAVYMDTVITQYSTALSSCGIWICYRGASVKYCKNVLRLLPDASKHGSVRGSTMRIILQIGPQLVSGYCPH